MKKDAKAENKFLCPWNQRRPLKGAFFFLFKDTGILRFCKSAVMSAESEVPVGEPDEVLPSTYVSVS